MGRSRSFSEIKRKFADGTGFGGKLDITPPRREVKELQDPNAALHKLYSQNREYPRGRPHEQSYAPPVATPQWKTHTGPNGGDRPGLINEPAIDQLSWRCQKPQAPEDRQRFNYDNDVGHGWLRGSGEDATTMPFFNHSKRKERR